MAARCSPTGRHPDRGGCNACLAPLAPPTVRNFQSPRPGTPAPAAGSPPPVPPTPPTLKPPAVPPSAEDAPTQTVTVVAVVNGEPASGYREVPNIDRVSELFGCDMPAAGAVSPNIYMCYPNASGADLCWPSPPASMLCLNDPWYKELRRFSFDTSYLPAVQPVTSPLPFAVLLDDGTRCRIMTGGARGGRPDRLIPAHTCGQTSSARSLSSSSPTTPTR